MVVLAKHGWRVFHHPSSLVTQVFKARYFLNSSFWEAEASASSLYCCQSIIKARKVLVDGSSFRAPEDRLVWHYDERGHFFVKSGYWVAQQWLQSSDSSASSSTTVAQLLGCQQVMVERDSLKAIIVLNETYADSSALGMIANDVLHLASIFSRVKFIDASRLCNEVAYHLAKFALSSSNNLVWFEEPSALIQELRLQVICNSG
ncbi:hypothetical protein ACFX2I_007262 [Malus domestica]